MMDFVKPQLHANFNVASFSHSRNIKGELQILGSSPIQGSCPFLQLTGWSNHGSLSFGSLAATGIQMVFLVGR